MLANTRTYVAPQATSGPSAQTVREPSGLPLGLRVGKELLRALVVSAEWSAGTLSSPESSLGDPSGPRKYRSIERPLKRCPRQESNLDLPLRRRKRPGFDMPQSVSVFGPCSPARRHGDWSRFGQIPLRLGSRSGLLPERALGSPSSKTSSAAGSGDPELLHDLRPMTARRGRGSGARQRVRRAPPDPLVVMCLAGRR